MQKIRVAATAAVVALGAGGFWFYKRADATEAPKYRLAPVEKGSIKATVSATGSLSAVRTVQVGTQVSGQIAAIFVDFNDRVRKGQLLARIDPTLAQQAVADADAGVERAQAQLTAARRDYERNKQLHDAKIITDVEFNASQSTFEVANANFKSAQIALQRARQNLSYTTISAPIDGVVVERNVDVGQTVAASLSAPQLFLIANDLSHMQILASVDESDIGLIADGQPVTFTVQSYPNESFTGTVSQVRLQSKTQDNVVNYTVVVTVENPKGKLLPGMTATVQFLTASANDVLTVPNSALRFRPTAEMLAAAGITWPTTRGADSARARPRADSGAARDAFAGGAGPVGATARGATGATGAAGSTRANGAPSRGSGAMLWYLDKNGELATTRVKVGLSDGQKTAVEGRVLKAGMQVIVGTAQTATAATAAAANPLQPGGGARRFGGPGGF